MKFVLYAIALSMLAIQTLSKPNTTCKVTATLKGEEKKEKKDENKSGEEKDKDESEGKLVKLERKLVGYLNTNSRFLDLGFGDRILPENGPTDNGGNTETAKDKVVQTTENVKDGANKAVENVKNTANQAGEAI